MLTQSPNKKFPNKKSLNKRCWPKVQTKKFPNKKVSMKDVDPSSPLLLRHQHQVHPRDHLLQPLRCSLLSASQELHDQNSGRRWQFVNRSLFVCWDKFTGDCLRYHGHTPGFLLRRCRSCVCLCGVVASCLRFSEPSLQQTLRCG